MNRRRAWKYNLIQKNIKDYIVPIIWGVLVLILILSFFFSWWDNKNPSNIENQVWLSVTLDNENSDALVIYPWDYRNQIEWSISLYRWERLLVREWSVSISWENNLNFKLNKLWELRYLENGNFSLSSWDVWINTIQPINIDMTFAKLKIWDDTNISLSQNEVGSTIYLISWFVEVSNLSWRTTVLTWWQRLTVSRSDASSGNIDLSLWKQNLDEFFLRSDWFILNRWEAFLNKAKIDLEETDSSEKEDSISINQWNINSNSLISFTNLVDESNVSSWTINISWSYFDEEVSKITLNWKSAVINKSEKTFRFEWVDTSKRENDLIFKVYDDSNSILSKFVYSVFYSAGSTWASTSWSSSSGSWFNVTTFDIDWSKFKFTSPTTSNTYTTTDTFVTIRGEVSAENVTRVTVNWFQLSSFNWKTWRYHADQSYNNLSEWTNIYEVKYYSWTTLVYTNYFTIIKRLAWDDRTAGIISNEVWLN